MAKNSLENASDKARGKKETLKKMAEELKLLRGQVSALADGPGSDALMELLGKIDLNLDQASKNTQNERKFGMHKDSAEKDMAEARSRIQRLGGGRSRKPAPQKPKEEQDPKIVDSQASKTDLELRERANIYNDAESSLQNFLDVIKEYALETDEEEAIKTFEARRDELMELATDPKLTSTEQNQNLQGKCNQFILDLGKLLSKIEARVKAGEEKQKKQPEPSESTQESKQEAHQDAQPEPSEKDYNDTEAMWREVLEFAKNYDVTVGRKNEDDFKRRLKELRMLRAPSQRENFRSKCNQLREDLGNLFSRLAKQAEAKKAEPEQKSEEKKEQDERDRLYYEREKELSLLNSSIAWYEKKRKSYIWSPRRELKVLQGYLDEANSTQDPKIFHKNIDNFDREFKKFVEYISTHDTAIGRAFKEGAVPQDDKKSENTTKTAERKEVGSNMPLHEAKNQWGLLKGIGIKLLSREKRQETNELTRRIEQILRLAEEAEQSGFPNEVNEQMKRFERSFSQLLAKIPEEVREEFFSQLEGKAPSWEKADGKEEKEAQKPAAEKEVKPVVKENQEKIAGTPEQKEFVEQGRLKIRSFHAILTETEWMHFLYENNPRAKQLVTDITNQLRQASVDLDNKDEAAYAKHIEQAEKLTNELINKFPKKHRLEYAGRLKGEETEGLKKERQERLDEIKFQQERVEFLEGLINASDASLMAKFASQFQSLKNALSEAYVTFGNKPEDVIKERDIFREKRNFVLSKLISVLGDIGGDAQEKIKKEFYKKFPHDSFAYQKTLTEKTEVPPAEPVVENVESKPDKPALKVITSEAQPVVAGQISLGQVLSQITLGALKHNQRMPVPAGETTEKIPLPPPSKKKGFFGRIKEGFKQVFNRETGKLATKVTYQSVASVLGLKIISDALLWATTGTGDMADWARGRKESGKSLESIAAAQKSMQELFDQAKNNKALAETEKTAARIAEFKKQLESPNLPPEIKQAIAEKLAAFEAENQEKLDQAKRERDEEVRRVMQTYEERKVSGLKIARDAMNFALTATGFTMLRGLMYAGVAAVERIRKAKKQHAKEAAEKKFSYKDVFVDAAIETAHGLTVGAFSKEKLGAKRRTINLIKSLGTVARGLGIYGLAITHAEAPSQSIDKLIAGIKEHGVASTISHNFIHNTDRVGENIERVGHLAAHPTEIFETKGTLVPQHAEASEHAPVMETHAAEVPAEVPAGFSVDQFAAEHQLSPEFSHSLDNLVHQYPELNNPESMQHILDASRVGGVHSHHEIIKSEIDTLDESGGERRQVIFEELLKRGGPESAANYLQSQNFSSRHLGYLSDYVQKDSHEEYLKFAQQYNEKDGKMVHGLFRAMQGRESTDLANAKMEGNGLDNHVRGKINYFGVEDKKPVISGSGEVRVVETQFSSSTKAGNAAGENEGMSTDDKLWANANTVRSMSGGPAYEGSSANAPFEQLPAKEQSIFSEIEADKARFANMGEQHIDVVGAARSGQPVGEVINNKVQTEAPGSEASSERVVITPTTIKDVTGTKVIHTYRASAPGPAAETKPAFAAATVEKSPELEKSLPVVETKPETVGQFLQEHNSNPKEFVATYDKMIEETTDRLESKFALRGDASEFLSSKIKALHNTGISGQSFNGNNSIDKNSLNMIEKLLDAENKFKLNDPEWLKGFSETVFDKSDKGIELLFSPDRDVDDVPILTNGGHGARIWDPELDKDIFIYDKDGIFSLNKAGKLVVKYSDGEKDSYTQQEIIEMSKVE